jgi:hypothetical protein
MQGGSEQQSHEALGASIRLRQIGTGGSSSSRFRVGIPPPERGDAPARICKEAPSLGLPHLRHRKGQKSRQPRAIRTFFEDPGGLLKNLFSSRLLKKVQMQGGARGEVRGVLSTYAAVPRERAGHPPEVGHRRWVFFSSLLGCSQQQFVVLALQELVNEAGLKMKVNVAAA